ncbi:MAG: flavodoxin family protein [Spirochaetes bacterium]|nr:flavodoxin family protein [Spirochaetota bacterium]
MKRILAVFGSPRKSGFSSMIHEAFLEGCEGDAIERIFVYDLLIQPCTGCLRCREKFFCPLRDDMTQLYQLIDACDAMSISTPLYFSAPPSPLKAFIDRCQPFWERNQREGRKSEKKSAFLIAVGGGNYAEMFTPLHHIMRHFFRTCGFVFDEKRWLTVRSSDEMHAVDNLLQLAREAGKSFRITYSVG